MNRPLLNRIINPGVQWWIAIPCNVVAGFALVLLVIDPIRNLTMAIGLLGPAAIVLYGTRSQAGVAGNGCPLRTRGTCPPDRNKSLRTRRVPSTTDLSFDAVSRSPAKASV
jgi:hypothetical protein